ncbi:MAG: tRNA (adenosine(37)-N6)-dimethylallyltransferase MiaA [Deltaproteobacteria bacterium]|jgi:tRNA dimethylallyltransferase|nr:tRNA (adenosine(37)-N6)-dimethylallyltransferase MiaA [Deltaproteobacteria bacterium]
MPPKSKAKALILTGPTGTGKSSLAVTLAQKIGGEIINCDSLAFYKYLDIGTAKPTKSDMEKVPHHLFSILEPDEEFCAASYLRLARPLIEELFSLGKKPIVVGGTGFYLRSLTKGLFDGPGSNKVYRQHLHDLESEGQNLYELLAKTDPLAAKNLNPNDRVRIVRALEVFNAAKTSIVTIQEQHGLREKPFETLALIVDIEKSELDGRIRQRVRKMFSEGLIEETLGLLAKGYSPELKTLMSMGYREAVLYIQKELTLEEAQEQAYLRTRRLAKSQRVWLKGQLPEGLKVPSSEGRIKELAQEFFGIS